MKKYIIIFLAIIFYYPLLVFSQPASLIEWQKTYGGSMSDKAFAMSKTNDGGYIVAGSSYSNNGDVLINYGLEDIWVLKVNNIGAIEWQKTFGGSGSDVAKSVIQTSDGGYIIAGYSNSTDGNLSQFYGGFDYWIIKLTPAGLIMWQKSFGGSGDDQANSIIQTNDGGYAVAGRSNSSSGMITDHRGQEDAWIVKIDALGAMTWSKSYGGSLDEEAFSIIQTTDYGYAVACSAMSNSIDLTVNYGQQDYWILKLTTAGSIQWQKSYGGSMSDIPSQIIPTKDGGFCIAGTSSSPDGDIIGNHGASDFWVVKTVPTGNILWQKCYGGSNTDYATSLIENADTSYVVTGYSNSVDGDVTFNNGMLDYWTIKLGKVGNIIWQKSLGGLNYDQSWAVSATADNDYIIAGSTQSNNGDVTLNHGAEDFWLVKLKCITAEFHATNDTICPMETVYFTNYSLNANQYTWRINNVDFDNQFNTMYTFPAPGNYRITLIATNATCLDSVSQIIHVNNPPLINLGSDTTICIGTSLVLNPGFNVDYSYNWSTFGTTPTIIASAPGIYKVTVTNQLTGCKNIDSIKIITHPPFNINLGADQIRCQGTAAILNAGFFTGASYIWSTGANTQTIPVTATGNYSVTVTNNNGCIAIDTIHVTINPSPVVNLGPDHTVCAGNPVTLDAGFISGGSYSWSSGQSTQTIVALTSGDYIVTVTNTFSCMGKDTVHVTINPKPNVNLGPDKNICSGSTISLDAGNFTGANYLWSTSENTQIITVSATGTYTVIVTNSYSCVGKDTINVTVNPKPNVNLGPDQNICSGNLVTLDAGSATGVTYYWSTNQNSQVINVASTGNYAVSVTNTATGCVGIDSVFVSFFNNPVVNLGPDRSSCVGDSVLLDAGYFTSASYMWSSGVFTQSIYSHTSGDYAVTVTAAGGCWERDTIHVTFNSVPVLNLGNDITSCLGDSVTIGGTCSGCSYLWDISEINSATINVTTSGIYSLNATDVNGCKTKDSINVAFSIPPVIMLDSINHVSCYGLTDGSIYTSIIDGTPAFSFTWTNTAQTNEDITNLAAGTYSLIVTDAVGCTDKDTFSIIQPDQLIIDSVHVTNALCSYSANGEIIAYASGGAAPYFYSIDNGNTFQSTSIFNSLAPASYSILIKDQNGCTASVSNLTVAANTTLLNVNLGNDTIICAGTSITLDAGYPGAVYNWSPSGSSQNYTVTTTGIYAVTVSTNGCYDIDTISVNVNSPIIIVVDSILDASCFGNNDGAIYTTVTGGSSPYNFSWAGTTQITEDIINLFAGVYAITVTDSLGCTANSSATVYEPQQLSITHTTNNPLCTEASNGSIIVNVNGGTFPYSYQWTGSAGPITSPVNLAAGIYFLTVTDLSGCMLSFTDTLFDPQSLSIAIDSTIDAVVCNSSTAAIYTTANGGISPYTFIWNNGSVSEDLINIPKGAYYVTVTDNNGCSAINIAEVYDNYCQAYVDPGTTISSICDNSTFIDLSPIYIIETADTSSGFIKNQANALLILDAPSGFEFNPDSGSVYFGNGLNDLTAASLTLTASQITINFSTGSSYTKSDTLKISGIEVKALNPPAINTQNIFMDPASSAIINGADLLTVFGTVHQSIEMSIDYVKSFQNDSNLVVRGSYANEIVGIRVRTSGNCGIPMMVEGFELATNGSDNPYYNIPEAKIYYTGNSPNFAAVNIQGTQLNPADTFLITVPTAIPLLEGDNYFWLAYDILDNANIGDFVDGEFIKVIVDGNYYYSTFVGPDYKREISTLSDFISHGSGSWEDAVTWGSKTTPWSPDADNNVTIINGDTVTLTANASCANLTITDGILILNAYQLTISGNLTGAEKDSIRSISTSSLVINDLGGKDTFPIPKAMKKLQVLTLNRAKGASCDHDLDLDDNVPSSDSTVLVLNNGILRMSAGKKVLLNKKEIKKEISSSNNSFVDGIVSRNIKRDVGFYTYPLGDNGVCRPFGIKTQAGNGDNISEVQFFWVKPLNYDYVNTTFLPGGITDKMYWRHKIISGANTARRIYYDNSDFPGLDSTERINSLCLANNSVATSTTEWTKETTPYTVNDAIGKKYVEFQSSNASNDEYWTFGSTISTSPLVEANMPIELYSFEATLDDDVVNLDWVTLNETNNNFFTVERAGPEMIFAPLFNVDGAGTSFITLAYHAIDNSPLQGTSFYRLKQTDFDGDYSYSDIRMVIIDTEIPVMIYPNPAHSDMYIQVFSTAEETVTLTLYDNKGSKVYENIYTLSKGNNQIKLDIEHFNNSPFILCVDPESSIIKPFRRIVIKY